jgi:hypothetical protein
MNDTLNLFVMRLRVKALHVSLYTLSLKSNYVRRKRVKIALGCARFALGGGTTITFMSDYLAQTPVETALTKLLRQLAMVVAMS